MKIRPNNRWKGGRRKADSKWEESLQKGVLRKCEHHPSPIEYVIEHNYTPDFKHKDIYIESKGRFMDRTEATKYVWIRKRLKKNEELVFLFQKPNCAFPHAKKRKDGTRMTHAEWAEKNNFRWFTEETIEEIL